MKSTNSPAEWANLVPENIRYGVTITPPQGKPVTGTYMAEQIETGDYLSVIENVADFNTNSNNPIISECQLSAKTLTITINPKFLNKTIFIRGLLFAYGNNARNVTVSFQNGYTATTPVSSSIDQENHAECTQIDTNFINTSGTFTISNFPYELGIALNLYPAYNTNELTPENIKEGVTINEITGTAKSDSYNGTVGIISRDLPNDEPQVWLSTNNIPVTPLNNTDANRTFTITNNYTSANYCSTGADYKITANSYTDNLTYANGPKQITGNYTSMVVRVQSKEYPPNMFIASFNS